MPAWYNDTNWLEDKLVDDQAYTLTVKMALAWTHSVGFISRESDNPANCGPLIINDKPEYSRCVAPNAAVMEVYTKNLLPDMAARVINGKDIQREIYRVQGEVCRIFREYDLDTKDSCNDY